MRDMNVLYEVCAGIPLRHCKSAGTEARHACMEYLRAKYCGAIKKLKLRDNRRDFTCRVHLANGRTVHFTHRRLPRLMERMVKIIDEVLENPSIVRTFEVN